MASPNPLRGNLQFDSLTRYAYWHGNFVTRFSLRRGSVFLGIGLRDDCDIENDICLANHLGATLLALQLLDTKDAWRHLHSRQNKARNCEAYRASWGVEGKWLSHPSMQVLAHILVCIGETIGGARSRPQPPFVDGVS